MRPKTLRDRPSHLPFLVLLMGALAGCDSVNPVQPSSEAPTVHSGSSVPTCLPADPANLLELSAAQSHVVWDDATQTGRLEIVGRSVCLPVLYPVSTWAAVLPTDAACPATYHRLLTEFVDEDEVLITGSVELPREDCRVVSVVTWGARPDEVGCESGPCLDTGADREPWAVSNTLHVTHR
ncbi:MAG: hypothetical protein AAF533_25780 [Acidobacteriota bacterium]